MVLHERYCRHRRGEHVVLVGLGVQLARGILARRGPAGDGQEVGRKGEVTLDREPSRHVLDMRVEAAVFLDHDDGGPLALGRGPHQVTVDRAFGRLVRHPLGREPAVVGRDDGGLGVIVLQQRQQRRGGRRRARKLGQAIEEFAPIDPAVGEAVVEIDDALVHECLPCLPSTIT
jgi:hypothetical protein